MECKNNQQIRTYFKTLGIEYFWASKEIIQNMATFIFFNMYMVLSTSKFIFSVGGQCKCKPYITGKKCDKCVADAYGIAPNCKGINSH